MAAIAAVAAWALGVGAAAWAWDACRHPRSASRLERLAKAVLAGWVLEGIALATLAVLGAAITPAAALLPVVPALLIARRRRPPARPSWIEPRPLGLAGWALLCGVGVRLAAHLWRWPWGQPWSWDVYAVWGFKARFLVATGGLWRYLSLGGDYPFSSADYPPLLPAQLAAVSWPAGDAAHAAIPDLVLLAAAAILLFELWRATAGPTTAAALVLLAVWPAFPLSGALVGLADRPLALLAAVATSLVLGPLERRDAGLLTACLAGMALLKNEGLPFALLLAFGAWLTTGRRPAALAPALGLVPAAGWHLTTALLGSASARLAGLGAPADFAGAARALLRAAVALAGVPDWTFPAATAAFGALALLAVPRHRWVGAVLLAQVVVVGAAILLAPYPLVWQLSTAFPRLASQLVPSGLAAVAAVVAALNPRVPLPPAPGTRP